MQHKQNRMYDTDLFTLLNAYLCYEYMSLQFH